MGKTKPRGKYQGVSLPVPFIQGIKKHIMKDSKYKTIAEFIREAVREKMGKQEGYQSDLDKFLMFWDEINSFSRKLEEKNPEYKEVTNLLAEVKDKVKSIEPKGSIKELKFTKDMLEYCKKKDITPSELFNMVYTNYKKHSNEKKARDKNGFRG